MRCLTRAVEEIEKADDPREAEAVLVEQARKFTTADLEVEVRQWRARQTRSEEELELMRYASRYFTVVPEGDGMYRISGRVLPEVGGALKRVVEAARDATFNEGTEWAPEGGLRGPRTREIDPRQARADALGLVAEVALAAGFEGGEEEEEDEAEQADAARETAEAEGEEEAAEPQEVAEGEGEARKPRPPRRSGSRAERYQVMIHVDVETLRDDAAEGRCHLWDGMPLSAAPSG